ncbi:hypothetical protein MMEU_0029 [Mycobacterium marinum str. Europe]|nr:hypothetical protein MMEU_0029 [Mycobacterium marinum str. Europe]
MSGGGGRRKPISGSDSAAEVATHEALTATPPGRAVLPGFVIEG